jgi:hypothetical protein
MTKALIIKSFIHKQTRKEWKRDKDGLYKSDCSPEGKPKVVCCTTYEKAMANPDMEIKSIKVLI